MKYPYAIVSDTHCYSWSPFSMTNADGVNSRLRIILDEIERAARTVQLAGGDTLFHAGDLFHVRGKIEPSVFNPTVKAFEKVCSLVTVQAIPGNHDLEGKHSDTIGNAMQTLGNIPGFNVHTKPWTVVGDVIVLPWCQDLKELRRLLDTSSETKSRGDFDVVIHAPVNGVIKGIPDHGLEAKELADLGFRRVFAGHYHDHKEFEGGKVISVGATTHQTWSDVGTKAGFVLVYEDRIEHFESNAPRFIDLNDTDSDEDGSYIEDMVPGNYARIKLVDVDEKELKQWRRDLEKAGAEGIHIVSTKTSVVTRSGASTAATVSLDASVEHYVRNDLKPAFADDVSKMANIILNEARK